MIIQPHRYKNFINEYANSKSEEEIAAMIDEINSYRHQFTKIEEVNMKEVLKVEKILPEFQDDLINGYRIFKDNEKKNR